MQDNDIETISRLLESRDMIDISISRYKGFFMLCIKPYKMIYETGIKLNL